MQVQERESLAGQGAEREPAGLRISMLMQSLDQEPTLREGASIQSFSIVDRLRAAGHEVRLLATRPNKRVLYSPDMAAETSARLGFSASVAFRSLESAARRVQRQLGLPWTQTFDSLRFYDACLAHLRDSDVFHERNSMHGIGGALASKRLNMPYVLFVDADFLFEHDMLGIRHSRLERVIAARTAAFNYRAADALVCPTAVTRDHLMATYDVPESRITVIPNGVAIRALPSPVETAAARAELGLGTQPVVVFVGSFHPWHGTDLLLDAFERVLREIPDARLLLVGEGQTRAALMARTHQLGIEDRVLFTGSVAHERVPVLLALADVAVAPYPRTSTTFWGSPMKLFEYMAAGKAVVASGAGQIRDVVEHGRTGLLAEPGDVEQTAGALLALLRNADLRRELGVAARHAVARDYSWEAYVARLERVYAQAIGRTRSKRR